jgi:hypothetical protein
MNRIVRTMFAALAVLVGPVVAAGPATALVDPLGPPPVVYPAQLRVVIDRASVPFEVIVRAGAPSTARGGYGVAVQGRVTGAVEGPVWFGGSDDPAVLVTGRVAARTAVLGGQVWRVTDLGTGDVVGLPVKVVRASRVTVAVTPVPGLGRGLVFVSATVTHFDPVVGAWTAQPSAPVTVSALKGRVWVPVGSYTSDRSGSVTGVVALPSGVRVVRVDRPEGARDGAASSPPVRVG